MLVAGFISPSSRQKLGLRSRDADRGAWATEPGAQDILIGASAEDIRLTGGCG
jgi:hypothetical protein